METPIIAAQEEEEDEEQLKMCDEHDVESQSARCEKPHLSSSCDAVLAAACTSSDDAACATNSDLDDAPPFCIRGYVAAVREINISKCWPFSQHLLEESIREGKQPLLPPLSPYGCVVQVISEYYHDGTGGSAHEDVDEACGANDGPQLQVQIDLSKFEAELDAHGYAGTNVPANPLNPSLEAAPLQELQAPCASLTEEATKHHSPFGDHSLVFKRQAPRSIREIRKSIMQGCQCFQRLDIDQACRKDSCSRYSMLPTRAMDSKLSSLDTCDGHFHDGLEFLDKRGIADNENVSGITQLEPCRKKASESQGVTYSHAGASPYGLCKSHGEMGKVVRQINQQSAASVPTSQVDVCENPALAKDMLVDTRTEYTKRRCSASDSQSVDKSHESHNLKSSNSRQCWDMATQQDSLDTIACLDNIPQQRCPVCLLFQSSSNTALNVHIDRCLAALSMEEGTTKLKMQKAKVRKKRSMAELCLVAPSSVVVGEHTNENTSSDCNIKTQKDIKKAAPENKDTATQKQNEDCKQKSKVNTFKLLQWGSRASSRHGASRRGPIHEARIPSMKNQSFQGRTLEWRTTSALQNTRNWKRQKTKHESVAELPQNVQYASEEKAQKLRKLIQRNKRVQNQNLAKDVNQNGDSIAQSKTEEAFNKLHGKVLPKHKTAALLPKKKNCQKASRGAAHVLTSDTLMTVIGSHETTLEFLHTDDQVNAALDQGDKNKEKVKLRVHIQPTRKHKKKRNLKTRADLQDASDLQLAIIRIPSISQKDCIPECASARPDSTLKNNPTQTHSGIAEGSLGTQMLTQPSLSGTPGNSRRIAEDWSIEDPSLALLSTMIEDHPGEGGNPPNYRSLEMSTTQNSAPSGLTCNVLQSNKSGGLTCFRDMNDIDVSLLPLGSQPNTMASLRKNCAAYAPEAWYPRQKEMEQIQVRDVQQAQVSHFASTTLPNSNSVSMQQFSRFPFSLSTTETPPWPGQFEGRNFLTAGSEGLNSSVTPRSIQPLEVTKRIAGANFTSQDVTARQDSLRHDTLITDAGRHFSFLQKNTEDHQYNLGSTQSLFRKDVCSAQNPSFPGCSTEHAWQAQNHSQRLPPWMQAAIQDQRSPALSSMGLSINSTRVMNSTPNINPEMSSTLSMFEMIGNPVLRLMGKTMVLMPETSQGHVDLTTSHLSGQSTYINFFQSLEPQEANYESQNQFNGNQVQNFHTQPGILQDYLSSDQFTCRNKEVESPQSRSIPQLQDFFLRTPLSSQIPLANQPMNPQNNGVNIAEQNHALLRGGSQLLSAMSHRAHSNWQHPKGKGPTPFRPQSSLCCPRDQMRPNLTFSEGGSQCDSFRSNITLPQAPRNSMHNVQNNVKTGNSNFASWLSSPVSRTNTAHQPADVIILDDEGPLLSFDTSASGPLGRDVLLHSNLPVVSVAQQNSSSVECREKISDSCRPGRENSFIPIIYTVGGNFIESQILPGNVGPRMQKAAMSHECTGVQNYGTAINLRKRASCFEQPGEITKNFKTREGAIPPSESGNCTASQIASMETLCAVSERMQCMARRGSISLPERLVGRGRSSLRQEQDGAQGQLASNVMKESRKHAPTVGVCSTNMNPAEVDCQDAGQFTSTPSLEIISERIPVHKARACMDIQGRLNVSMSPQPAGVPTQEPGCSDWPLSSTNVSTPNAAFPHGTSTLNIQGLESSVGFPASLSLAGHKLLLQALNKRTASKENSRVPIIYNSSKKPSFCVTLPTVKKPCSLLPEGAPQDFFNPATQPGLQASVPGQGMHSLKVARKFVITNGRVSIMDAQRNKGSVHTNAMDVQKDKWLMHANMINVQRDEEFMQSNQTDKAVRNANGQNDHVPDDTRQHEKTSGDGRALVRDGNDQHEAAAAPAERSVDTVCGSL